MLSTFAASKTEKLTYCVTAAQQILVLLVEVRILIGQPGLAIFFARLFFYPYIIDYYYIYS